MCGVNKTIFCFPKLLPRAEREALDVKKAFGRVSHRVVELCVDAGSGARSTVSRRAAGRWKVERSDAGGGKGGGLKP